jgi:hypothetical protein
MPPWFDEILKQSPILAVTLAVAWVAYRYVTKQHDEHLQMMTRQHEAYLKALTKSYERHLASKDAEIGRLGVDKKALQLERDALMKKLIEVNR